MHVEAYSFVKSGHICTKVLPFFANMMISDIASTGVSNGFITIDVT